MTRSRYEEAVDYLQRRLWKELPILPVERALQSRIRTLLAHFGDPHLAMPVVHVGGSAGKGSTATMTASILRAAGLRPGLYTSPHLQTFIERVDIDGRLMAPADFADAVLALDPLVRKMHIDVLDGVGHGRPSLVEVAFAVAMQHFAHEHCDATVVEVGLGGRTDCTNVFESKPVTVLTNVGLEHRDRLGDTVEAIAREKAALIRGGETVVSGAIHRDAARVIEARCAERGAALWRLGREVRARITATSREGSTIDVRTPGGIVHGVRLPLAGAHQAGNAAMAVAAAQAFATATGAALSEDAARAGLETVRISGRMEVMQQSPRVILDGAHNPMEARRLAAALRDHELVRGTRLHLVVGILDDKEQAPMVRALASVAHRVVVTTPPLAERAAEPARTLDMFRRAMPPRRVSFEPDPQRALDAAIADASTRDIVCATGSMFLIGALRERWVPEARIRRFRHASAV